MISGIEYFYMLIYCPFVSLYWVIPIQVLCPFLIELFIFLLFMLNYSSSLYILDINLLSDIRSANIFSCSLFHSHNNFFKAQMILILMKSNLLIFSFVICHILEIDAKPNLMIFFYIFFVEIHFCIILALKVFEPFWVNFLYMA